MRIIYDDNRETESLGKPLNVKPKVAKKAPKVEKETKKETPKKEETKEDEERELLGKVSFVKKGIHLQSISQVDLEEMHRRQLITEEKYKKW